MTNGHMNRVFALSDAVRSKVVRYPKYPGAKLGSIGHTRRDARVDTRYTRVRPGYVPY